MQPLEVQKRLPESLVQYGRKYLERGTRKGRNEANFSEMLENPNAECRRSAK